MAGITVSGVGSGLDISSLVSQLVDAERTPTETRLNTQEAKIQAKLSAYGTFKSALSTFNTAVASLTKLSTFSKYTATSSDEDVLTASGALASAKGSYSIEVSNLAKNQKLASGAFESNTTTVGEGTLTFRFGTYDSGGNTFTANDDSAVATVEIGANDSSLEGIRDAVNKADIGVTASIVKDASGYRLVFKSDETGTENSLEVTVSGDTIGTDTDDTGLSQLAYDPTAAVGSGKNLTQTDAAEDAQFTIDGLALTSSSNTVEGAIEGLTLNLKEETSGSPVTLKIAQDKSAVTNAVETLVASYNSFISTVNQIASYDQETQTGGVLVGDSLVRSATSAVRSLLSGAVGGSDSYRTLSSVGVSFEKDGTLSLDSSKLSEAMDDDMGAVMRLFAVGGTPSDSLVNYDSATSSTKAGTYAVTVTQLATQAAWAGGSVNSFTIDSSNDTFGISVDGISSGTITLTQRTYASGEELAAEIQSRINANEKLNNAGKGVTVSYVGDHLEITSNSYGSNSKVKITSVDTGSSASLGLSVGSEVAGLDVAGTIGGRVASGSGRYLTATSGDATGLKIEIEDGTTGDRGTVTFGRGVADQLSELLSSYLGSDSLITVRTNGLNASLDDINDRRDALETRVAAVEKRYRAQFTALDTMLAQLQQTSEQLTQQLASLPGVASSN